MTIHPIPGWMTGLPTPLKLLLNPIRYSRVLLVGCQLVWHARVSDRLRFFEFSYRDDDQVLETVTVPVDGTRGALMQALASVKEGMDFRVRGFYEADKVDPCFDHKFISRKRKT